jgi:membrane-associated phospholipid phosphatase
MVFIAVSLFTFSLLSLEKDNREFSFELTDAKEAFIFSAGLGLMTSFMFTPSTDFEKGEILALNKYDLNAFDRTAVSMNDRKSDIASDVLTYSLAAVPLLLFVDKKLNRNFSNSFTYLVMYAESALIANGISRTVKTVFQRNRPYVYNDSLSLKDRTASDWNLSFPSNHTVNAFNSAVFISTVFTLTNPDSKWVPVVWSVSLSAAVATGILRVTAGEHYPTDVIAGAVLGSLTGLFIPLLHKVNKKNLSVVPVVSSEYGGLQAVVSF